MIAICSNSNKQKTSSKVVNIKSERIFILYFYSILKHDTCKYFQINYLFCKWREEKTALSSVYIEICTLERATILTFSQYREFKLTLFINTKKNEKNGQNNNN